MKDRNVEYPNRYKLNKVTGTDDIYDLVPAPGEVNEAGTILNKSTLLSDTTAANLGFAPTDDPTIDDAFNNIYRVGDVKPSMRTDLDNTWALCNGAVVDSSLYPELNEILPETCNDKNNSDNLIGARNSTGEGFTVKIFNDYLAAFNIRATLDSPNNFIYYKKITSNTWIKITLPDTFFIRYMTYIDGYYIICASNSPSLTETVGYLYYSTSLNLPISSWKRVSSIGNVVGLAKTNNLYCWVTLYNYSFSLYTSTTLRGAITQYTAIDGISRDIDFNNCCEAGGQIFILGDTYGTASSFGYAVSFAGTSHAKYSFTFTEQNNASNTFTSVALLNGVYIFSSNNFLSVSNTEYMTNTAIKYMVGSDIDVVLYGITSDENYFYLSTNVGIIKFSSFSALQSGSYEFIPIKLIASDTVTYGGLGNCTKSGIVWNIYTLSKNQETVTHCFSNQVKVLPIIESNECYTYIKVK